MTHRVGAKGQVVIPKEIRDRIGILPGDEVDFQAESDGIKIWLVGDDHQSRTREIRALRGRWAGTGGATADDLVAERRLDREREELGVRKWQVDRP